MAEMIPPPEWGSGPNNPEPPSYLRRGHAERRAEASRKSPATVATLRIVGVLLGLVLLGSLAVDYIDRLLHASSDVHHRLGMLARYSLWSSQVFDILVVLVGDRLWTYVPFYSGNRRPPPRWYYNFWKPNLVALFIMHFLVLPTILPHILAMMIYLTSEWE